MSKLLAGLMALSNLITLVINGIKKIKIYAKQRSSDKQIDKAFDSNNADDLNDSFE